MKRKTKVVVKGLNQEKALNKLVKKINIYNLKREKHDLSEFEIDEVNKREIKKIISSVGLEIVSINHQGIFDAFKRVITSYGLILAIAICSLFYAFQYNFVLKISIFGLKNINKSEIISFVDKNLSSRLKNKINTKELEILIKQEYEDISSVSVAIVGQSLVINVNEGILSGEDENQNAIISNFDGLITDINLIQGTLAVDVGQVVKKGDVLVYPYIIDSQGEQRSIMPKAEIFADIWLKDEIIHYDYRIVKERTGNKFVRQEICLNNLVVYSHGSTEIPFNEYELEKTSIFLSKNNILPLKKVNYCYYELVTKEIFEDFESNKDIIIQKAREKVLIFLQKNEIIKEENFTIREAGGIHRIEYVITVNRNIGC